MTNQRPRDADTIAAGKAMLRRSWREANGVDCPCCTQKVKLYPRPLNYKMAAALIYMAHYFRREDAADWLHVPTLLADKLPGSGGDYAKMRFWGLIEPRGDVRDDGSNRSGYYRITKRGLLFVDGLIAVPKYVYVFNNKLFKVDDDPKQESFHIDDALAGKFNYTELMRDV